MGAVDTAGVGQTAPGREQRRPSAPPHPQSGDPCRQHSQAGPTQDAVDCSDQTGPVNNRCPGEVRSPRAGHPGAAGDHRGATPRRCSRCGRRVPADRRGHGRRGHHHGGRKLCVVVASTAPTVFFGLIGVATLTAQARPPSPSSTASARRPDDPAAPNAVAGPGPRALSRRAARGAERGKTGRRHGNGFCACWASRPRPHRATGPASGLGRC